MPPCSVSMAAMALLAVPAAVAGQHDVQIGVDVSESGKIGRAACRERGSCLV